MTLEDKETSTIFSIFNAYGLFLDRRIFWDSFVPTVVGNSHNVIIVEDLNLMLPIT